MKAGQKLTIDTHFGIVSCRVLHTYPHIMHLVTRTGFEFFIKPDQLKIKSQYDIW